MHRCILSIVRLKMILRSSKEYEEVFLTFVRCTVTSCLNYNLQQATRYNNNNNDAAEMGE